MNVWGTYKHWKNKRREYMELKEQEEELRSKGKWNEARKIRIEVNKAKRQSRSWKAKLNKLTRTKQRKIKKQ